METADTLFIVVGLLIPAAVVGIVVIVVICIRQNKWRKRKHFKEVSFKDNPILTGRLPETPRNSQTNDLSSSNKTFVEKMPNQENETSFIIEYKAATGQIVSNVLSPGGKGTDIEMYDHERGIKTDYEDYL